MLYVGGRCQEIPGSVWKLHCAYLNVGSHDLKAQFSCCHDSVAYSLNVGVHVCICGQINQHILLVIKVARGGYIRDCGQKRIFFITSLDNG